MKFLFASDSFKGTLSSPKIAELLTQAAREIFPDCVCDSIEVADGGEGTTEVVLSAVKGTTIPLKVHGPLWEELTCSYGMLDEKRAVMEMAAASGLPLVPDEKRDPRYTTSYGTGEMIRDALERGFRDISIAIGGSATNDGGIGCIRALGGRFLDENGEELKGCGGDLIKIKKIDISGLNPLIKECRFTVMCDVTNPLCGKDGATYTFGRQKGATPEIQDELEKDWQSVFGKVMQGIGIHCKAHGIPAVAIVGSMGKGAEDIFEYGIESMITTINGVMTLPEALDHAEELYLGAARRLFRMLRAGRKLSVAVNGVNSNDSHKSAE